MLELQSPDTDASPNISLVSLSLEVLSIVVDY